MSALTIPTDLRLARYDVGSFFTIIVGSDAADVQAVAMTLPSGDTAWLVDRRRLAGAPVFAVHASGTIRPHTQTVPAPAIGEAPPRPQHGSLRVTLTGARWPGTDVPADFELQVFHTVSVDEDTVEGSVAWAFGGGRVPIDETYSGTVTGQVSVSGAVCALGADGGIALVGPASAAATFRPGSLRMDAAGMVSVTGFGEPLSGDLIEMDLLQGSDPTLFATAPPTLRTRLVIATTSPWPVAFPATVTPIGKLTKVADRFARLAVETGEEATGGSRQAALFVEAPESPAQYRLTLGEGVSDAVGNPVQMPMFNNFLGYDFDTTPPHIELRGMADPGVVWVRANGIGILLGLTLTAEPNTRFAMDGEAISVLRCDLPYTSVAVPLDGTVADPVDTPSQLSILPAGATPSAEMNPNWLVIGALQNHDVRLFLRSFALQVIRPDDLLALTFRFTDMALYTGVGLPIAITRTFAGQPGYLAVDFPPQHVAEEVLPFDAPPLPAAASARLANPTRLAFQIPGDSNPMAVTLDNLLYWTPYPLSATTAVPSPQNPVLSEFPPLTGVELPWRLVLSPSVSAGFSHALRPAMRNGRTELWHTRLGVRRPVGEVSPEHFVDERIDNGTQYGRRLRAVWSPDTGASVGSPFPTTIEPADRAAIVRHSSAPGDGNAIVNNRLMLSALGGWLDASARWEAVIGAPDSLTAWRHIAAQGRDHYVRLVHAGQAYPFRHRASLVTISERRFSGDADNTAYLRQWQILVFTQPLVNYQNLWTATTPGRDLPLSQIEVLTLTTPPFDLPPPIPTNRGQAFWIPMPLHLRGSDSTGAQADFFAPMIFVDDTALGDPASMNQVSAAYASAAANGATRSSLNGQPLALAPSNTAGDTTLAVHSVTFGAGQVVPTGVPGVPADPLGYYPTFAGLEVHIPAARTLASGTGAVDPNKAQAIKFTPEYLDEGIDAVPGEVFASLDVQLPIGFSGERATGVAAPNMQLSGLSRQFGTVAGDLDAIVGANPRFDPAQFFPSDASLLGGITLQSLAGDILKPQALGGSAGQGVPVLKVDTSNPAQTVTTLDWQPAVSLSETHTEGLVALSFDSAGANSADGTFKLHAESTAPTAPSAGAPSAYTRGSLTNFKLDFASLVSLHFAEFTFHAEAGRKPEVTLALGTPAVTLEGQLALLQTLMDKLKDLLGSGPSIDIQNGVIQAGYAVAIPQLGIGVFSLENIRLGVAVLIPLTGTPPASAMSFRFNFAERNHPFNLTISLLGGGGFFAIALDSRGVRSIEFAVEAGASVAIDLGVASGSVQVMIGVYFQFDPQASASAITGYLRAGGEVTVLQLISLQVELYLGLTYVPDEHKIWGEASLTVDVTVCALSKSVTITMRREFDVAPASLAAPRAGRAVRSLAAPGRVTVASLMTQDDWVHYANAFA